MKYNIRYVCISHIGKVRQINQDNYICNGEILNLSDTPEQNILKGQMTDEKPVVFGVFDGMGGEQCGEMASFIAAMSASELEIGDSPAMDLAIYCKNANTRICDFASANGIASMGTTAAMLAFVREEIYLCNIGDSKVFRYAEGKLEQISQDHYAMAPFGRKPPLLQNLGIPEREMMISPYFGKGIFNDKDLYLICSDGLTDMVSKEQIESILKEGEQKENTGKLLETALANGGRDNITIILCRLEEKTGLLHRIFS